MLLKAVGVQSPTFPHPALTERARASADRRSRLWFGNDQFAQIKLEYDAKCSERNSLRFGYVNNPIAIG
jgi:hypothetical protein